MPKKINSCIAMAALLMALPTAALAGERWECSGPLIPTGQWEVEDNELISPPGDFASAKTRFKIVKDDNQALIGFMGTKSDRFELVMIDKQTFAMKMVAVSVNNSYEDRLTGACKALSLKR
jgi:hypothetical protein